MTKEEKRRIKWLISDVTKYIKSVEEDIAAGADLVFVTGNIRSLKETFAGLKKLFRESGVLK